MEVFLGTIAAETVFRQQHSVSLQNGKCLKSSEGKLLKFFITFFITVPVLCVIYFGDTNLSTANLQKVCNTQSLLISCHCIDITGGKIPIFNPPKNKQADVVFGRHLNPLRVVSGFIEMGLMADKRSWELNNTFRELKHLCGHKRRLQVLYSYVQYTVKMIFFFAFSPFYTGMSK